MAATLNNIKIVLCDTSHQGNIGATARAMKTMGIVNLTLVNPLSPPDDHAIALSCNASDVVLNAKIATTLDEALTETTIAVAMTSRKREFTHQLATPKEIVPEIFKTINAKQKVAIVFGAERNGLTIEQLEKCNRRVTIPGNPDYFSLNLAQAVQIMCYEIYSNYDSSLALLKQEQNIASFADNQRLLEHFDITLRDMDYYKKKNGERVIRRLQSILHKASLEREDVDMLHGILRSLHRH